MIEARIFSQPNCIGGYQLFRWQVKRAGGSEEDASDIFLPGILGVLIGARLGHVLFYDLDRALADPAWVLRIWEGGLASHGAVIGLLVAIYVYARQHKQSYFEVLDRFAYSAALGAALVRLGNFFNSEIVGRLTDQSWGVRFPRYEAMHHTGFAEIPLRHPTQLYEFSMGLFVMLCIYLLDRFSGREKRPRGALIAMFFCVYFPGRMLVENFKAFQTLAPDAGITMGQILSVAPALVGFVAMFFVWKLRVRAGWNVPEEEKPKATAKSRKKKRKKHGK